MFDNWEHTGERWLKIMSSAQLVGLADEAGFVHRNTYNRRDFLHKFIPNLVQNLFALSIDPHALLLKQFHLF